MKFKINKLIGKVMGALSKPTTQYMLVGGANISVSYFVCC